MRAIFACVSTNQNQAIMRASQNFLYILKFTLRNGRIFESYWEIIMAQSTRDKILQTTFLLLIKKGYDRVLVSDIQESLGISRGLLYRYFNGKTELFFEACRKYFYDRYFPDLDYDKITLAEFFQHAQNAVRAMTNIDGEEVDILKYNTLYSAIIQSEPRFKLEAQIEFDKARKVIRNAIKRGEIKTSGKFYRSNNFSHIRQDELYNRHPFKRVHLQTYT